MILFQTTEDQTIDNGEYNGDPVKAIPDQLEPLNVTFVWNLYHI